MKTAWTNESLKSFETEVADIFNRGEIRAPVHLSDGNEDALIEIFGEVSEEDWVFCSWRSHYQCLLKGVPKVDLMSEIMAGHSITLAFPEYRIFSSAIVGGQVSIAVGAALAEKRKKSGAHVWCFMGDMTAETGIAQSSMRYALSHDLPITFIVEDNGISVCTVTREVWGSESLRFEQPNLANVKSFKYQSKYPHAGAGTRVQF